MGLFDYWRNLLSRTPQNQYEAQHRQEIQDLVTKEYMTPKVPYTSAPRNIARPEPIREWYKTPEGRRYLLAHNPEFQKQHPAPEFDAYGNPLSIQEKQNYWDRVVGNIKRRDLNAAELNAARYNANPTKGFFPIAESVLAPNYLHSYSDAGDRSIGARSFVSLDIETDDRQRPISISALRFVYDTKTGKFHSAGNYQRFYETDLKNIRTTYGVHGLTPDILKKLRSQQGATYSTGYFTDPREEASLREFIGSSTIVGQNIVNFDLPTLFHGDVPRNNVIDTVIAARNVWKNRPNGLEDIFKRVMGKTMEEAGLSHHDANADTLATMMVLEKMAYWKGPTGDAIRYVMSHQGVQLAPVNEMLKGAGQVITGTYQDINRNYDIGDMYMSAKKITVHKKEDYVLDQSEMNDMIDPSKLTDEQLLGSSYAEVGASVPSAVSDTVKELQAAYNSFSFWRKSKVIQDAAHARSSDEAKAIIGASFSTEGEASRDIMTRAMRLRKAEALEDIKGKHVSKEDLRIIKTTKSFDELNEVLNRVTESSQKWGTILGAIARIKPYDINQYFSSAQSQWQGIMGASKGVIPDFIRGPMGRLGDASFNYWQGRLAPWNAFNRTWNATAGQIGNAAMGIGIATGNPIAMGVGGVLGTVNGITQIYGNYKQQQMETKMLGIQNTLNTLGALTNWIATPFRLLHRATKLLIGSFSGLTLGINNFMKNGIGAMSQMGNPLSDLTGVNYAAYEGTTMMDVASLFNKGSMNSIYEDFAKQQKAFYTLGQVNTNRLVASSLLGVYGDVYSPSTDTEGTYNAMVNKILASMQGQSAEQKARTMYLASEIDSNLPGLLRTANMLGVTDINTLTDPTNRGMYWRPLSDAQEKQYRWTQYEYGAASQQWGRSKMKIANMLWQSFGKDIYNGINGIVDMLSENNWKGAVDQAKQMWIKLKETFSNIWGNLKKEIFGDGESEGSTSGWAKSFKILGLQITSIALEVGRTILNIWNTIMATLIDKAEGLIAYLSTVSLETKVDRKGNVSFKIHTISNTEGANESDLVYKEHGSSILGKANFTTQEGMDVYADMAKAMYGDSLTDYQKATLTGSKVNAAAVEWLRSGKDLDLSDYGYYIPGFENGKMTLQDAEDLTTLFDALAKASVKGDDEWWKVAAWQVGKANRWKIANYDDRIGVAAGARDLLDQGMDIVNNTIDTVQNGIQKVVLELKATDSTGKTHKVTLTEGQNFVTKDLIHLRQLMADGLDLVVQQISGN